MPDFELASFIDLAILRPDTLVAEYDQACNDALEYRFRGLCVPSGAVNLAKRRLMNSGIKVVCAVGFPLGNQTPEVKVHEATRAAALGADEIDYVISIGAALENDFKFLREECVAILRQTRGKLLKAILEIGYLSEEQRYTAAKTLAEAGAHYVKTCTGFGPTVVTPEDVQLLFRAVEGKALVKASGGVREKWQALELIQAGAAVIGTSHGPRICAE